MNVNEKGAIGLIEVIRDLVKKGFECFTPIHDYSGVDLIALDNNKKPIRLQVKYRKSEMRNGESTNIVGLGFHSVVNGKKVPIDISYIDGWAIYCPEIDSIIYINKKDIDSSLKGISFRLTEGKQTINKDKSARKLYSDFTDITNW
jgi:hypothetical protein